MLAAEACAIWEHHLRRPKLASRSFCSVRTLNRLHPWVACLAAIKGEAFYNTNDGREGFSFFFFDNPLLTTFGVWAAHGA